MKEYLFKDFPSFLYGADYNPEQWLDTPEVLDEDMRLFRIAKMNEMSVGIFSWSKLEPAEGVYDFSWLDDVLDRVYRAGGRVFLRRLRARVPVGSPKPTPTFYARTKRGEKRGSACGTTIV